MAPPVSPTPTNVARQASIKSGPGYEAVGASISTLIFAMLAMNFSIGFISLFSLTTLTWLWWVTSGKYKRMSPKHKLQSSIKGPACFTVGAVEDGEASIVLPEDDSIALAKYAGWIRNFLDSSNSALGRSGPVCPFVPRALRIDSIHLTVSRPKGTSIQGLQDACMEYKGVFDGMCSTSTDEKSTCLVICFPGLSDSELVTLNEVPRRLMADFVQNGLMVSAFSPTDMSPGVHNRLFRPRQAPCPSILIRKMVKEDLVFLSAIPDHPKTIAAIMTSYLKINGLDIDPSRREAALTFIAQAQNVTSSSKSDVNNAMTGRLRSYSAELNEEDMEVARANRKGDTSPMLTPMKNLESM